MVELIQNFKKGSELMFSEELKEARLEKGLTQQSLSQLLEVPKRTIESWEAGVRKPPEYVKKLILEKLKGRD